MASLQLRDITLSQMALTRRRQSSVMAVEARPRYAIDPQTRQRTSEVDGYSIDILCMGKAQSVKLPKECAATVSQVQEALQDGKTVWVSFDGTLRAKPYALLNDGNLISGISASATTLILDKSEKEDDILDFEDEIVE